MTVSSLLRLIIPEPIVTITNKYNNNRMIRVQISTIKDVEYKNKLLSLQVNSFSIFNGNEIEIFVYVHREHKR